MATSSSPVRVRFAPSPTGLLHIGGLRTALYNYLLARKSGGTFILRIEDTDQTRYVPEAEPDILTALDWAGLSFDEGPGQGGPHAPYYQSQRRALYQDAAQRLIEAGYAYYAFDTPEELDDMKERLRQAGNPSPKYDVVSRRSMKNALTLSPPDVTRRLEAGEPHVVRLKVPQAETVRFEDQIRGWVSFETDGIDDQVLVKSDGLPTYHLANVVDDHEMRVTHVVRGEEWLPSTPKHALLYRFLGWQMPQMAHLPLILSPNGGKLSKRSADRLGIPVSVRDYIEAGYEPEALVNFLAFLGWNPGDERELLSLEDLVEAFSLDRVGASGVQFNLDKLNWYNEQYLRMKSDAELAAAAHPVVEAAGLKAELGYLEQVAGLMKERITKVKELPEAARYFFEDPQSYDAKTIKKRWKASAPELVNALADQLERHDGPLDHDAVDEAFKAVIEAHEVKLAAVIHPTRLALTGVGFGPSVYETMVVLGKEVCVRRLRRAAQVVTRPEALPSNA